ncbi:NAD(P)-dependent oxidoreductase [Cloacibacillus sp. An23]|uniref:NAD(P)-dependent oxidoreductase n=1 Tax=Cloacibacillus sp. An23 TaxID=1965591 RepID=UPI000B3A5196|nr:NAD(P)-dependent oxidoreductase [Cloacibacillus sp. An23]OUO94463.1 NADH-flavin reductase [Cloacibacillus sp. An23]
MKIAVICANGKAGKLIAEEAVKRGHDVTAIVRGENRSAAPKAVIRDVFDITAGDLKGFDAVADAFGAWTPETLPQHVTSLARICGAMSGSPSRLYIVGGAGSLYTDAEHKTRVMDAPDFPDVFKPLASNMGAALDALRARRDVKWTYLSPAADFRAEGERTGKYKFAGEEFTTNAKGESFISYADYAAAMLDVIESGKYENERISVYAE